MSSVSSSLVAQHERASRMQTKSDVETWLDACEDNNASSPPFPISPSSPKWETPKAHLRRQKQRQQRAEKAAQKAQAELSGNITSELPNQTSNSREGWIPEQDLCRDCPILAPHRKGLYAYGSPELPKKILIIQAKIMKARATEEDIKLQDGFAAVHTNDFGRVQAQLVVESANTGADDFGMQTSDRKKPRQQSQCQHPECPIRAWHRSGYRSRPKKIENVTAKIKQGNATEDDFRFLSGFLTVHDAGEDNESGRASSGSVEIIC